MSANEEFSLPMWDELVTTCRSQETELELFPNKMVKQKIWKAKVMPKKWKGLLKSWGKCWTNILQLEICILLICIRILNWHVSKGFKWQATNHQSLLSVMIARILVKLWAQNCLVTLWEGDLSHLKAYKDYWVNMRKGSPLILCNYFIQFIEC